MCVFWSSARLRGSRSVQWRRCMRHELFGKFSYVEFSNAQHLCWLWTSEVETKPAQTTHSLHHPSSQWPCFFAIPALLFVMLTTMQRSLFGCFKQVDALPTGSTASRHAERVERRLLCARRPGQLSYSSKMRGLLFEYLTAGRGV